MCERQLMRVNCSFQNKQFYLLIRSYVSMLYFWRESESESESERRRERERTHKKYPKYSNVCGHRLITLPHLAIGQLPYAIRIIRICEKYDIVADCLSSHSPFTYIEIYNWYHLFAFSFYILLLLFSLSYSVLNVRTAIHSRFCFLLPETIPNYGFHENKNIQMFQTIRVFGIIKMKERESEKKRYKYTYTCAYSQVVYCGKRHVTSFFMLLFCFLFPLISLLIYIK